RSGETEGQNVVDLGKLLNKYSEVNDNELKPDPSQRFNSGSKEAVMIPLSRSALGRIFVYGAVILFLSGTATPQVKQSLPNHCWALDQKKAFLSLVQVLRSRSKHQGEYWFHFA